MLLSETTTALVQDELPEDVSLLDLGWHRLKDMRRPAQPRVGGCGSCNDPAAPVESQGPGDQHPVNLAKHLAEDFLAQVVRVKQDASISNRRSMKKEVVVGGMLFTRADRLYNPPI